MAIMEEKKPKRLYRSHKNKVVGGVLGGVGEYLGVEPIFLRAIYLLILIFAISVYLVLPLLAAASFIYIIVLILIALYVILWLVVPVRNDAAQK